DLCRSLLRVRTATVIYPLSLHDALPIWSIREARVLRAEACRMDGHRCAGSKRAGGIEVDRAGQLVPGDQRLADGEVTVRPMVEIVQIGAADPYVVPPHPELIGARIRDLPATDLGLRGAGHR